MSDYDEGYRAGMQKMREVGQHRIDELEAKVAMAVEALDEALYFLRPDEEDIAKKAGMYRIVKTYEELSGKDYEEDDD